MPLPLPTSAARSGWGCSATQSADGIRKILDTIRVNSPDSKVLLLGILPRSWDEAAVKKVGEVNSIIIEYADNKQVFYFDAGPSLLDKDAKISKEIFRDGLHLSPQGYEIFAQVLLPEIKKLSPTP
ncbi:MAG: GDSL-type esterase/lipase family protein [Lentisphaerota bacterium]